VNAIAPGPTDTEALRAQVPQDYIKSMLAQMPLARLGTPQDLLKALVFLLSEDAAWVTGLVMNVDGGQWMRA
jgi:3-oxoacyl-[acyl-carrier protein] reductase